MAKDKCFDGKKEQVLHFFLFLFIYIYS